MLSGNKIGAALAKLFGEEPRQQVRDDLRRFQQVMEKPARFRPPPRRIRKATTPYPSPRGIPWQIRWGRLLACLSGRFRDHQGRLTACPTEFAGSRRGCPNALQRLPHAGSSHWSSDLMSAINSATPRSAGTMS